jgi:hypothetical protein
MRTSAVLALLPRVLGNLLFCLAPSVRLRGLTFKGYGRYEEEYVKDSETALRELRR